MKAEGIESTIAYCTLILPAGSDGCTEAGLSLLPQPAEIKAKKKLQVMYAERHKYLSIVSSRFNVRSVYGLTGVAPFSGVLNLPDAAAWVLKKLRSKYPASAPDVNVTQ